MKYLPLLVLIILGCTNDNVQPNPPASEPKALKSIKSGRLADCEETTYDNGLVADGCEVGMGGTLTRDTYIDGDGHLFRILTGGHGLLLGGGGAALVSDDPNDIHATIATSISGIYPFAVFGVSNFYGTQYDYTITATSDGIQILSNGDPIIQVVDGKIKFIVPTGTTGVATGELYRDVNGFIKQF